MDSGREIDLDYRLVMLLDAHGSDIYDPPPSDVLCDCISRGDGDDHFHVRCMLAECDECGDFFQQDFFAYTKAAGLMRLVEYARENGWFADEWTNYFLCPSCRA